MIKYPLRIRAIRFKDQGFKLEKIQHHNQMSQDFDDRPDHLGYKVVIEMYEHTTCVFKQNELNGKFVLAYLFPNESIKWADPHETLQLAPVTEDQPASKPAQEPASKPGVVNLGAKK